MSLDAEKPGLGWGLRVWQGFMLNVCLPEDRAWVQALLSELTVIEGVKPRLMWVAGASNVIAVSIKKRGVAMLSNRFNLAMLVAFVGTVLTAGVSQAGYEGVESLDDVFLPLAFVFGAIFAALVALALGRFTVHAWQGLDLGS
jgi:hypothetical protein